MTSDEIYRALADGDQMPVHALAAAVADPSAVAPKVLSLLHQAAEGVYLLPDEENIVYFGLHALAAARHTDACPAFVAWLRHRPEAVGDALFGEAANHFERQVLLGLFDGNADALFAALEDPGTEGDARWTLFAVLARLAWDERIDRGRLLALIDRFDREVMAPPGDWAWHGWQDAIMYLGLDRMRDRVRRAWNDEGPLSDMSETYREQWLEALEFAVASPRDPQLFVKGSLTPPKPDTVLPRFRLAEMLAGDTDDPAQPTRLAEREMAWLSGFLTSKHVSVDAMDMEMLDGFLTALAVGPVEVPPSELIREIWDPEGGESPDWHSPEQERYATDLVQRYLKTIVDSLASGAFPELLLSLDDDDWPGRRWALGFVHAVDLRLSAWTPLMEDPNVGSVLVTVIGLANGEGDGSPDDPVLEGKERDEVLTALPYGLVIVRDFWTDPKGVSRRLAASTAKAGRNAPCPCGSGKKFKKCCGARSGSH